MGCGETCCPHNTLESALPYSRFTSKSDPSHQESLEQGLPVGDVVENGKKICADHVHRLNPNADATDKSGTNSSGRRACALCMAASISFATLGGIFVPRLLASCPTTPFLLVLWMVSSFPPFSGFVGATLISATLGILSGGWLKGFAMALCSMAGLSSVLVAFNQKSQRNLPSSFHAWARVARMLRWPCEVAVQATWMLPLMLTLPFRLPVAIFLDFMAAAMLTVGDVVLGAVEDYTGYTLAESMEEESAKTTGSSSRTPIILIHGLNGSRAVWLIGLLILRAKAKHLGPFVALRSVCMSVCHGQLQTLVSGSVSARTCLKKFCLRMVWLQV
jgi:hypothetical protein